MKCRLEDAGYSIGLRLLEMLCFRERNSKREIKVLDALKFVHSTVWKYLFGRQARDLEQSNAVRPQPLVCCSCHDHLNFHGLQHSDPAERSAAQSTTLMLQHACRRMTNT